MASQAVNHRLATRILHSLKKEPFDFQVALAVACRAAVSSRKRLLVVAPTGTGKTLVAQLTVALIAASLKALFPRVLLVIPSRALLAQHSTTAAWLAARGFAPTHVLHPEASVANWRAVLQCDGLIMTTPVALVRRLDLVSAALQLEKFDCAIFDEIDTYVTVGDQGERRDTWPALKTCMAAGLPILGFTGTGLSGPQIDKWRSVNFQLVTPEIPDSWLPLTRVRFVPVDDESVVHQDQEIHDRLSDAYRQIVGTHGPIGWAMLKKLAIEGEPVALRILSLSFQRLRLFESFGSADAKLKALVKTLGPGPALMMTRFRDVGHLLAARLNTGGKEARVAEGSMRRGAIEDAIGWFRDQEANQKAVLVLTRELGGRGLDFPHSRCMGLLSPRSNYQAVAQELARIRSRRSSPKEVSILYYARTEEEAKAARLASHLRQERFGERRLFELFNVPKPTYVLEPFESRNLTNEESIRPALGLGSHSFKA